MDRLRIISPTEILELEKTRNIYVFAESVSISTEMASARIVKDMIGHRTEIEAEWDAPPADVAKLCSMIELNPFLTVEYFDPKNGDSIEDFEIDHPKPKVFRYKNGEPMWRGIQLTMRGQVVRYA